MSNLTKSIPYVIKTNGSITMYLNSESMTVESDHPNYSKIVDALKTGNFDVINHLVNIGRAVSSYARGAVVIKDGQIFYGNFALHNTLTSRIIKMMGEGFKFDHMVLFLQNLMQNPSMRAVNETYTFLENHGLPITDDGCFLAYKAVRNNYTDIRTGTFDNKVGASPSMLRNQVDENYEADCSSGLHVGSLGYVIDFGHFVKGQVVGETGNRLLIVKVNPRDVVSVPKYASHTKMRVSTYTVVDEIKDVVKELEKVVYSSSAKEIQPDAVVEVKTCSTSDCGCDCKDSSADSSEYDAGWEDGESDRDGFNDNIEGYYYGVNRDYSRGKEYTRGYNAGFKGTSYNPNVDLSIPLVDTPDYKRGFFAGEADYIEDKYFGETLVTKPNELLGYRDGWESAEEDHTDSLDDEDVDTDDSDVDDSEYSRGFQVGEEDYENNYSYLESTDGDESSAFLDGYRDGYNGS